MPVILKVNRPQNFGLHCVFSADLKDLTGMTQEGWDVESTPTIVETPYGKATELDGVLDAIHLGSDPLIIGLGDCTVSMMVLMKTFDVAQTDRVFDIGSGSTDRFGVFNAFAGTNMLTIFNDIANSGVIVVAGSGLSVDTWYHLVWTMGSAGMTTYVNAVPGATNAIVLTFSDIAGAVQMAIGRVSYAFVGHSNIVVKNMTIWNTIKNQADVTALYNDLIGLGTNP